MSISANLVLKNANVTFSLSNKANYDDCYINISISTDKVAPFVTFTTLS